MKTLFILLFALPITTLANNKSICGIDDRVPSKNPKVARALKSLTSRHGCTVTMISNSCAISVGHCKKDLKIIEFNTPESTKEGIQHPSPMDIYYVNQESLAYKNNGPGDDWAVMKIENNEFTNYAPGEVQGYYEIANEMPEAGAFVKITGYGYDDEFEKNFAQQTNIGELKSYGAQERYRNLPGLISHKVDTMGGNSGSSIVEAKNNQVIGVHSHGGCNMTHYSNTMNKGTSIILNKEFNKAVKECLDSEKEED